MTKIASLVLLCCAAILLSVAIPFPGRAAEEPTDALKDKLVTLEKQSWEAWKNHDGDFFDRFLSNDHMELGFGGPTSKAQVVKGVASGVCQVEDYSLKDFQLQMLGTDIASLTYHESQTTSCQGKPVPSPCWVSSLYVKRDGRWLNVLYQQTTAAK